MCLKIHRISEYSKTFLHEYDSTTAQNSVIGQNSLSCWSWRSKQTACTRYLSSKVNSEFQHILCGGEWYYWYLRPQRIPQNCKVMW